MIKKDTKVVRVKFSLQSSLKYFPSLLSHFHVTVINHDLTDHIFILQGIKTQIGATRILQKNTVELYKNLPFYTLTQKCSCQEQCALTKICSLGTYAIFQC